MKRFLPIIVFFAVYIFAGCTKSSTPASPVINSIEIQSISYPTFANSTWVNVLGGEALLQFDLLDATGAVSTTVKDSISLNNIGLYDKVLKGGTYNVYVSSANQTAVADTFIRFNASVKSLSIQNKTAASLTATSTDGLITIAQSFVQSKSVPIFKPDSGSTSYKFGLVKGFYYLYVRNGVKGTVSFTALNGTQTETASKSLTPAALTQYNLGLQTNNGSLALVFMPFTYNQVQVASSTLLTININTADYYITNSDVYFVATDESGNILNSVKYVQGTTSFKFASLAPYQKDRFNFFIIKVPLVTSFNPSVIGYLQVKKGSTYTNLLPILQEKNYAQLKPHLQNATSFDDMEISSSVTNVIASSVSDTTSLQQLYYSPDSTKLWVQMLKDNQYSYNFFSVPKGATDINIDVNQLTETPLSKTIQTSVGGQLFALIYAKPDVNYADAYRFKGASVSTNQLNVYYPSESFPEYDIFMGYTANGFSYRFLRGGSSYPDQAPVFNASFNNSGTTLSDFVPSCTGTYDYYHATFLNATTNLQVDLYSPSAANYTNIKLPDFSTYPGLTGFSLNTQILSSFDLEQYVGFNEQTFTYRNVNEVLNFPNFSCNSVFVGNGN